MTKNYYGITDMGRVRKNNEDAFIAEPVAHDRYILAAVIDGVGGYEGGEIAAGIAHDTLLAHLNKLQGDGDVMLILKRALAAANEKIYSEKQLSDENGRMSCVLTVAIIDMQNNQFYYVHVGDTRLYLLRDKSLVKITKDHSFVGFLEDSDRLTEEAAMKHPKRNEINKALGFDASLAIHSDYIESGQSPFLPGDMLLLCSDGLTDMVNAKTISFILSTHDELDDKAKSLIEAANDAGGKDNVTAVLVWNDKPSSVHETVRPAMAVADDDPDRKNEIMGSGEEEEIVVPRRRRKGGTGIVALSILCLLLLGALAWMVFKPTDSNAVTTSNHKQTDTTNAVSKRLQDTLNGATGDTMLLSSFGQSVVLNDTLLIQKDSMYIKGNGMTITSDSAYKGPAFLLAQNCKYVVLDSLVLDNFAVGIIAQSRALNLKNIQFKNCLVPLQYQSFLPAGQIVNGNIDSLLFPTDTLLKK
ncbi:MAG: serine/threonine-protein phosphatase [Chitinophagaceae bacterium]|nr:serine/threonine-protein phosphatase [Chitinophagaceae bacterium]